VLSKYPFNSKLRRNSLKRVSYLDLGLKDRVVELILIMKKKKYFFFKLLGRKREKIVSEIFHKIKCKISWLLIFLFRVNTIKKMI
jgi:hypothetical protein